MFGPDALDWLSSAHELGVEFSCHVWLELHTDGAGKGNIVCVASPPEAPVGMEWAVVTLPHPNTKFQSFWPSCYLLLHRLRRELEDKAYRRP